MSSVLMNKGYEEYLISNMKKLKNDDPYEAEAWMITARSLFAYDFNIQFESYKMVCDYKNATEAASYFSELLEKFKDKPELLSEMRKMTSALCTTMQSPDVEFEKSIFQNLSDRNKRRVLTIVADHCDEPMEHCTLMLLLLRELPSQVFEHGEIVISTLLSSEKQGRYDYPMNPFRKLLVCEAMPIILSSPNFKLDVTLLFNLMLDSIEFFICYLFTSSEENPDVDFANIIKLDSSLASKEVHKMWKPLLILLKTGGQILQWSLMELFSSQNNFLDEMNWEMMASVIPKKLSLAGSHCPITFSCFDRYHERQAFGSSYEREVFCCAAVIYFYALYQFVKIMNPMFFSRTLSNDVHYVLIEGIHTSAESDNMETVSKKFKYDRDAKRMDKNPPITVSQAMPTDLADRVTRSFITTIKMWDIIHQNSNICKEFSLIRKIIGTEKWTCFQEFYIDMLIYQSRHKDAITHLSLILQSNNNEFIKNKARLQIASCFNYIGENLNACEYLFDVICRSFPYLPINNSEIKLPPPKTTHHLHFIPYSFDVILCYCIELLICIYKKKMKLGIKDSTMLGHILVLSQYKWPREEEFFLQCIRIIQLNGSFCYSKFFDYIIVPGILEEFLYLTTLEGGNITLDLLPTSTMQIGKQRAVTRGVNKGAKDDLKVSMRKQMARCQENLNELLVTFIKQEHFSIKQIIM